MLTLPNSVVRELRWSRELSQGCIGPEVKRLQEWLCLHGCGTGVDGDFGSGTRAAVRKFQEKLGVVNCNGVADRALLEELSHPLALAFGWSPVEPTGERTLRQAIAVVAQYHLSFHPREAGGDNRGPWVRAYCGADGPEYRWCAGCALSIVRQAATALELAPPLPFTLSCDVMASSASQAHRFSRDARSVRRGDLFLVRGSRAGDWIHTGIVLEAHADYFETAEGNTNDDGSANGFEMCSRSRGFERKDFVLLDIRRPGSN